MKHSRNVLPAVGAAAAAVLAAGLLASPAAAETAPGKKFDFDRLGYTQVLRAGAIETFADIPRRLPQDVGYSRVVLDKDVNDASPSCQAQGAGYFLSEEVEEGVIKGGAAPIAEGQTQSDASPYTNVTESKRVRPVGGAGDSNASDADPAFPSAGNGPLWTSACRDDMTSGTATGDLVNASGLHFAGSTSTATVDRRTGVFTATARAYVVGLEGALDSVSSLFQITYRPGSFDKPTEPMVTYRMSFFNSDASKSGFTNEGFTLGGTQIPASDLVNQFNQQAAQFASSAQSFGPVGFRLLAPDVYPDQDSGRETITAPAAVGNIGFATQAGSVGQNFGVRLASVTWTGYSVYIP
jgi:hypothetical protein